MRGLLSGGIPAARVPATIPLSLMAVVQNALSHAWRVLLAEVADGRFSICHNDEDVITEQLYMILGTIHATEPEVVKGFALFETPVREGNLRNRQGDRLDCQPDLTFRPLKGHIPTTNSAITGIFIECKPIDSQHPVGSTYCKDGLSRFVQDDYAWAVDRAIMLAYVRNICHLPDGLHHVLDTHHARKNYKVRGALTLLDHTDSGDAIYCSAHDRELSTIHLHHLWLRPVEPCESSRCKSSGVRPKTLPTGRKIRLRSSGSRP